MIRILITFLLLIPFAVYAQPGDLPFRDPCPDSAYDLFPLDSLRADLHLHMFSEGTEDIPSGAGTCSQAVGTLPHSQFLYRYDGHGHWDLWLPEQGTVLHPDSLTRGIATYKLRWDTGDLRICGRGYGSNFTTMEWQRVGPRGWTNVFVRVIAPGGMQLSVVRVSTNAAEGLAGIHALAVAHEGEVLRVP